MAHNATIDTGSDLAVYGYDLETGGAYPTAGLVAGGVVLVSPNVTTPPTPVTDANGFPVRPATSTTWAISAASLPLPSGAASAANQAAGNTSLASIDGKLPSLSGGAVPVTGPLTDAQLRTTAVPVSAASLPLPSGAATAAKQPALGTAGSASADVMTIQGVASMTPVIVTPSGTITVTGTGGTFPVTDSGGSLTVDDGGSSITVDGTVGISGTVTVSQSGTVTTVETRPATGTASSVSSSASSVTLLSANANRRGAVIYNDSTQVLYVKLGATASATSFAYRLAAGATLELPEPVYTGIIDGIWASANGHARVTEIT